MHELTWLPYVIAAALIAGACWFTFRRVPEDANHGGRPEPPR